MGALNREIDQFNQEVKKYEISYIQQLVAHINEIHHLLQYESQLKTNHRKALNLELHKLMQYLRWILHAKDMTTLDNCLKQCNELFKKLEFPDTTSLFAMREQLINTKTLDQLNKNLIIEFFLALKDFNNKLKEHHGFNQINRNNILANLLLVEESLTKLQNTTADEFDKNKQAFLSILDRFSVDFARMNLLRTSALKSEKLLKEIYDTRSTYLPDYRSPLHKINEGLKYSWLGLGAVLVAVPAILAAVVSLPIGIFALGIVGAVYGAVDLSKELVEPISSKKLGAKYESKPKLSKSQQSKKVIKKAWPILLSALGATLAVAAIVFTAGIAGGVILGASAAVVAASSATMVYRKYQKNKKVQQNLQVMQNYNQQMQIKQTEILSRKEDGESSTLLIEEKLTQHNHLTPADIQAWQHGLNKFQQEIQAETAKTARQSELHKGDEMIPQPEVGKLQIQSEGDNEEFQLRD